MSVFIQKDRSCTRLKQHFIRYIRAMVENGGAEADDTTAAVVTSLDKFPTEASDVCTAHEHFKNAGIHGPKNKSGDGVVQLIDMNTILFKADKAKQHCPTLYEHQEKLAANHAETDLEKRLCSVSSIDSTVKSFNDYHSKVMQAAQERTFEYCAWLLDPHDEQGVKSGKSLEHIVSQLEPWRKTVFRCHDDRQWMPPTQKAAIEQAIDGWSTKTDDVNKSTNVLACTCLASALLRADKEKPIYVEFAQEKLRTPKGYVTKTLNVRLESIPKPFLERVQGRTPLTAESLGIRATAVVPKGYRHHGTLRRQARQHALIKTNL